MESTIKTGIVLARSMPDSFCTVDFKVRSVLQIVLIFATCADSSGPRAFCGLLLASANWRCKVAMVSSAEDLPGGAWPRMTRSSKSSASFFLALACSSAEAGSNLLSLERGTGFCLFAAVAVPDLDGFRLAVSPLGPNWFGGRRHATGFEGCPADCFAGPHIADRCEAGDQDGHTVADRCCSSAVHCYDASCPLDASCFVASHFVGPIVGPAGACPKNPLSGTSSGETDWTAVCEVESCFGSPHRDALFLPDVPATVVLLACCRFLVQRLRPDESPRCPVCDCNHWVVRVDAASCSAAGLE